MKNNKQIINFILWASRIILGLVFAFSGFVKIIDPLGSAYKFEDYFLAFNMEWAFFMSLPMSILMSTLELVIGLAILLGLKMKYSAWGGLLFMAFFTPLTLYLAVTNPISDCGCFGEAIIFTNWETFYKNVFLMAAAIFVFIHRKKVKPLISETGDYVAVGIATALTVLLGIYCLLYLPIIDFRPWKVGNDISELVISTPEEVEIFLVYKNNKTGETKEYDADNIPWNDEEWTENWTYKEQRRQVISPAIEAEIEAFYIESEFGDDLTEYYINNEDFVFMVVSYGLKSSNKRAFENKIIPIYSKAKSKDIDFIVLTGSTLSEIDDFNKSLSTELPFYLSDEIELKTVIRSNPGLVLLKDGVILDKWSHRSIPDFEKISGKYLE